MSPPLASGTVTAAPRAFPDCLPRTFKRRATTACSWCQFRKIRCNVEESNPCSNCALEKIECTITKRRRTKKDQTPDVAVTTTKASTHAGTLPRPPPSAAVIMQNEETVPQPGARQTDPHHDLLKNTFLSQTAAHNLHPLPPETNVEKLLSYNLPESTLSVSPSMHSGTSPSMTNDSTKPTPFQRPVLPEYLEPVPEHLSSDDLDYLHKKGSFDIPSEKFRNALICSYVEWSHPYYPMMQIGEFLADICQPTESSNKLSLLVFQAVLFAGSAHCDIKPLRMMGFMTRKAARRALFERTKALYHFGYEQNRISVIQALILMSLWYSTPDDQMDAHHWLTTAVTLARRASLNRDPTNLDLPPSEKRLRKRIWWCCLIRDPLLALGLKRPIIISPSDHDVPELTLDDFDLQNLPSAQVLLTKLGILWDVGKLRIVRLTCMAEANLHQCLSRIMSKQYAQGSHHRESRAFNQKITTAILLPVTTDEAWRSLSECEESLRKWREALPPELTSPLLAQESSEMIFDTVKVFRTVVHLLYHACIIMMYRPWLRKVGISPPPHTGPNNAVFQFKIQTAIRVSAHTITDLVVELHKADLARHLPQTGLSAMAAATVSHISDTASSDPSVKESAIQGFEKCSHVMNELRENYYAADFTCEFINLLARAKNLTKDVNPQMLQNSHAHAIDLDEQTSAQKRFLDPDETPASERWAAPDPRANMAAALALPDTDLRMGIPVDEQNCNDASFGGSTEGLDASALSGEDGTNWIYDPDFRAETSLLGDFFDDYRFSLFNVLPGIDLGG